MPVWPRISVITPTLNASRYLHLSLASIRAQQYPDLEHFVVDGGSADRTEEIVRTDATALWLARPGLKQAAAINAGLRLASGEVVAWLNADDLYAAGGLAYVAERFAADQALDVLYGDCQVVDADGQLLWHQRPGEYSFERLLQCGNNLPQPAVFLRRRVFDQIGYLDESLDYAMDYELWLRLRRLRVEYAPRVLAVFRWQPTSKTARNNGASWREALVVVRRHGGGWTPCLVWAYARAQLTHARQRLVRRRQEKL